ncbi:DNA-binding LacI/PurR family transcriptional regulator [Kibdelosporangium banguiense]|uniref:DNA-binding LacI/PurR family transcriptional regulator n=1 Tax=Kibdelosporangium banguiense TaxID=1365924 RepID=A0ABS4T5V0_9PSEU|nr:LacI family DNA-binding transcriptional regulator [Kibdelosporangium banguiense]MBP2319845.1 DNA-binding LacI/PurR family transcriptional regulator [Kibdelosporangium banguiense]
MSSRRPTLDTVAREVGVSRATVSNAYNRPDQLSERLREEILSVAARLGYAGPDPVARSLATQRAGAVAVMLDKGLSAAFSDPALSIMLDTLASTVDTGERSLVLMPGGPNGGGPLPAAVARVHADVVVAYSLPNDARAIAAVQQRGLPLVVVDQPADAHTASVRVNDREGAQMAAHHVAELGHRDIGILSLDLIADGHRGPVSPQRIAAAQFHVTIERLAGYRAHPAKNPPIWEASESVREFGREGAHWLLAQSPRPTALLCMSDELAIGAIRAAREIGLVVPDDLTIVGFDDTPAAAWSDPPLTTVRQDLLQKGRQAGELVLRLLEGLGPGEPVIIGATLVTRTSSAAARQRRLPR